MDLIHRQAAIDALGDKPLAWTEGEYELGLQNQWQSDVDALKALPSAQQWIPCTEQLPEVYQWVLVSTDYGDVYTMYLTSGGYWSDGVGNLEAPGYALAWMPLPEPYNEEDNVRKPD